MKYKDVSTKEDKQNRIMRIKMIAETWEENEQLAKGMGIEIPTVDFVECEIDLKKGVNHDYE